jgi:hypothetical protein
LCHRASITQFTHAESHILPVCYNIILQCSQLLRRKRTYYTSPTESSFLSSGSWKDNIAICCNKYTWDTAGSLGRKYVNFPGKLWETSGSLVEKMKQGHPKERT